MIEKTWRKARFLFRTGNRALLLAAGAGFVGVLGRSKDPVF
jgi:hypothetical protein